MGDRGLEQTLEVLGDLLALPAAKRRRLGVEVIGHKEDRCAVKRFDRHYGGAVVFTLNRASEGTFGVVRVL